MVGHTFFFDPTLVDEDSRVNKLSSVFGGTAGAEIDPFHFGKVKLALGRSVCVYNDLSKVGEQVPGQSGVSVNKTLTIQAHHLDVLRDLTDDHVLRTTTKVKISLSVLGCSDGFASKMSSPDGYYSVDDTVRGIIEVKHNTDTPAEALRQGASEATNVALSLLKKGVCSDDICVPVIGSNGYLIQFAAVIMLKPSFPTLVVVSPVLDLTCDAGLNEATRLYCCVQALVKSELPVTLPPNPDMVLGISEDIYHLKYLWSFFSSTGNIQTSLHHYFHVMARLHKHSAARKYTLFPICVREHNDSSETSAIVFPKLSDFRIGLPDTPELRALFLDELRTAMFHFHEAGVVHLDMYLSNIMWKQVDGGIAVKVIDWDSGHFIDEPMLWDARSRLESEDNRYRFSLSRCAMALDEVPVVDQGSMETKYLDLSLLKVFQHYSEDVTLQVTDKMKLDDACKALYKKFLDEFSSNQLNM